MKVNKVTVAFINDPYIGALLDITHAISTRVRTRLAQPRAKVLMAFMIGHLQFELDVIAYIRVLPHQELNTQWELTIS